MGGNKAFYRKSQDLPIHLLGSYDHGDLQILFISAYVVYLQSELSRFVIA